LRITTIIIIVTITIAITIAEHITIHRPVMLLVQLRLDCLNVVWRWHQALACSSFPSMRLRPPFHRGLL
jgi:hypothetical protein